MVKIKGVNLGNWLVLEKWMSPSLFAGTAAEDEYYLPTQLSRDAYEARIQIHRNEYISERDFAAIARMGFNTVRIPVPYFIFGDRPPFIGCVEELDRAFAWAEKYGLKILIDLHTVPMSQNGFDNGGISGVCRWAQLPDEVDFVVRLLEKLAVRYGRREGLWGIEPLNEPLTEPLWASMNVQKRYPPVDPDLAAGSGPISLDFLRAFYDRAFDAILPHLGEDRYVVFHDGFLLHAWEDFLTQEKFRDRVVLDTHQYLIFAESNICPKTLESYVDFIHDHLMKDIAQVQRYVPVVCGEWCIANSLAADGRYGEKEEKKTIYMTLAREQLAAWDLGAGSFYWTYKMLLDTVCEGGLHGLDSWDVAKCVDQGWFPNKI